MCYREWINKKKNNQPTVVLATVSSVTAATSASVKKTETAKNPENCKRSSSTINDFEKVPLAHGKSRFIPRKTAQKTTSPFTAKEQMDQKKELKKEKLNKINTHLRKNWKKTQ